LSDVLIFAAIVVPVTVVLAVICLIEIRQVRRLSRRLDALTRGADGQPLEGVLDAHLASVFRLSHDVNELTARASALEAASRRHYGRVGVVRFNPFDDTGGNQSFAVVMLDADENGLILSSLHSRNGTRLYAKEMTAGRCDAALSTEEEQALEQARAQGLTGETGAASKARGRQAGPARAGWGEDEAEAQAAEPESSAGRNADA
jgi:hypothetical protein